MPQAIVITPDALTSQATRFYTKVQEKKNDTLIGIFPSVEKPDTTYNFSFIQELKQEAEKGIVIYVLAPENSDLIKKLRFLDLPVHSFSQENNAASYLVYAKEQFVDTISDGKPISIRYRQEDPKDFSHFSVFNPNDSSAGKHPTFVHNFFIKKFLKPEGDVNVNKVKEYFERAIQEHSFKERFSKANISERSNILQELPLIQYLYALSTGIPEALSIGYHTPLVLENIETYSDQVRRRISSMQLSVNDFALFCSFYESGKGLAKILFPNCPKEKQYEFSYAFMDAFFQAINLDSKKRKIFEILLKNDPIGQYRLKQIDQNGFLAIVKKTYEELPEEIRSEATQEDLFNLFKIFHKMAAGSYLDTHTVFRNAKYPCLKQTKSDQGYQKLSYSSGLERKEKEKMHDVHMALKEIVRQDTGAERSRLGARKYTR